MEKKKSKLKNIIIFHNAATLVDTAFPDDDILMLSLIKEADIRVMDEINRTKTKLSLAKKIKIFFKI